MVNATVSGAIAAALGFASMNVFQQIYLGQESIDDIDRSKKVMESELGQGVQEKVTASMQNLSNSSGASEIGKVITEAISGSKKQSTVTAAVRRRRLKRGRYRAETRRSGVICSLLIVCLFMMFFLFSR